MSAAALQSPTATPGGTAFLQIRHIVKQFDDVFAVDDVSLDIAQGEIYA